DPQPDPPGGGDARPGRGLRPDARQRPPVGPGDRRPDRPGHALDLSGLPLRRAGPPGDPPAPAPRRLLAVRRRARLGDRPRDVVRRHGRAPLPTPEPPRHRRGADRRALAAGGGRLRPGDHALAGGVPGRRRLGTAGDADPRPRRQRPRRGPRRPPAVLPALAAPRLPL
ncbi:MAG: Na(+) H(+) antiporter subunit E, partial [uncultured Thermomicrobiales bacterium]